VVTQATITGFNSFTNFYQLVQSNNNGGWFNDLRGYGGPENTVFGPLGLFDPNLLAVTTDANGVVHYFGVIAQTWALLEHYIETGVQGTGHTTLSYEKTAHMMAVLPWK
jgi:hypothetical protein